MTHRIAEIDLDAFEHNLALLKQKAGKRDLLLCLKANAYGHDVKTLLPALTSDTSCWVATLDEGLYLRQIGYLGGIVINTTPCSHAMLKTCQEHDLSWVLFAKEHVAQLASFVTDQPLKVWVKCNTGMHRLGVAYDQLEAAIQALNALPYVKIEGIVSHLANAAEVDHPQNIAQRERFEQLVAAHPHLPTSLYNSSGLLLHTHEFQDDWVRPGIALYGASTINGTTGEDFGLKPVMTLKGEVIVINQVQAGERVGYDSSWEAPEDGHIAVIAMGYADGYPRYAPNGTPVLLGDTFYPMAGRVSMDVVMVYLGKEHTVKVGDWATLWGKGLPVETIAKWANTTAHTLLSQVGQRVKRVGVSHG